MVKELLLFVGFTPAGTPAGTGSQGSLLHIQVRIYRMSQFVGGNLCWRFLRKITFGGFYFGDFLHLQELGVAQVNGCAATPFNNFNYCISTC